MWPGLTIRPERSADVAAIRAVNERAFGQPDEAALVDAVRARGERRISLVAVDGRAAGSGTFSSPRRRFGGRSACTRRPGSHRWRSIRAISVVASAAGSLREVSIGAGSAVTASPSCSAIRPTIPASDSFRRGGTASASNSTCRKTYSWSPSWCPARSTAAPAWRDTRRSSCRRDACRGGAPVHRSPRSARLPVAFRQVSMI